MLKRTRDTHEARASQIACLFNYRSQSHEDVSGLCVATKQSACTLSLETHQLHAGGLPPWIVAASSIFGACGAGEHQHARLGGGARRARRRRARTTVEAVRRADGRLFCFDVNALAPAARSKRVRIVSR